MAASVCVHACSSSVLHEAQSAQLFREHLLQQSGVGKQVARSPCSKSYSQPFGTSGVVITGVSFLLEKGAVIPMPCGTETSASIRMVSSVFLLEEACVEHSADRDWWGSLHFQVSGNSSQLELCLGSVRSFLTFYWH